MSPQSDRSPPNTLAHQVYKAIRNDIINGAFSPGTHLVKRTLAKKYGVSVPPVIEALIRLESDGLVENSPLLGTYVMQILPEKIEDELIFREAIEGQVARVFAKRAGEREKKYVMMLAEELDQLQEKVAGGDKMVERKFQQQHCEFHIMLAKLSGADILYQQVRRLWFRRLMLIWNMGKDKLPGQKIWHRKLADHLNSGDPERAYQAMREHLNLNIDIKTDSRLRQLYQEQEGLLEELLFTSPGEVG